MIRLFGVTDTTFATNGDVIIQPKRAVVHKEDNGSFYLDLETDLSYAPDLSEGRIVVANLPNGQTQPFRINNLTKTKTKLVAKCLHVFYDTQNYLINDTNVVNKDCNDALDQLNNATSDLSPFTTLSNVGSTNNYRCVRTSLYDAINVVLERWGGHIVRDNFNIQIRKSIGQDNGIVVRYGKNLKDITCEENWDNVVTKLLPVGKDGLLIDGLYISSAIQYDIPYTKTVSFNQDHILQEDYTDEEGNFDETSYSEALMQDLLTQANNYLEENSVPKVNYTLKANLEDYVADIGDTIEVIDNRLGISIMTNVIAYDYDCILEKYIELEFGNFQQKLSDLIGTITNQTQEIVDESVNKLQVTLGKELEEATAKIWGALGNSHIIYDGDKILVLDAIPKQYARNVIMINSGGIGFSQTGINGTFQSAWTIDNVLNMEQINVINLTADLIKGGTLKLGSRLNQSGILEVYDEANNLIAEFNKSGLKMYGVDGSYVLMNNTVGFAGYDRLGNQIYWVNGDEFHMKKSVVEEEITLCNKMRFIPITITDNNNNIVNDGIGLVSTIEGGD